jgi:NADPH:quinone reductase
VRALVSFEPGGPDTLRLVDVLKPVPSTGQVLLSVKACGVNYPDFLQIADRYQVKTPRPFSPGAEVAGIVSEVGPGVTAFQVGQRVAARIGTGGMAEFVVADATRCSAIPDAMPFADAAVMQFTFETAYYALHDRARLVAGETVLILGAGGGVGTAAIQLARNLKARVVAAASSNEKLDFARQLGAHETFLYPTQAPEDLRDIGAKLKAVLGKVGADVIVDPSGGWLSETALRCLAEAGRYLVLGFTAGIPSPPLNLALLKNADILGINWRTFTLQEPSQNDLNREQLHTWYRKGLLSAGITAEFPLDAGGQAIQCIADRRALGKVVVTI